MLLNLIFNNNFERGKYKCIILRETKEIIGITLIALVISIIVNMVFYDKNIKLRNLVGSSL